MVKQILLATLSIAILLTATACETASDQTESSEVIYRVTRETGLYSALSVDADQIAVLSAGTEVIPVDEGSLDCTTITEASVTLRLCQVKVVSTGQTGWILRKTIEPN
jgi:hypothetical protein